MSGEELRREMITSAVKFLTDPKVLEAPLAKRIGFLESKGLTQNEIQAALAESQESASTNISIAPLVPARMSVLKPERDWKDLTLAIIGASATTYGIFMLAHVNAL